MKTNKILTTIFIFSMLPVLLFTQTKKITGTYIYSDNEEYIQLSNATFKIIRTQLCTPCVNLNKGDSIASYGSVEYIQDNFIKLRSDIDSSIYKSITIDESNDASIKDSIKIRFIFPFKGKYRIDVSLIGIPRLSVEEKCITIPRKEFTLDPLAFEIYNIDLKYNGHYGEFFGRVAFCNFPLYQFKNKNTNSLLINIPKLTNSYFARYLIDGEYVKVETDKIIWRNREYRKISAELITPIIEFGDKAVDDVNGIDIIDKR